jgi:hypothetical protein
MDIQALAQWATTLLAPALSYLMTPGQKALEEIAKQAAGEAWQTARSLWDKLRAKIETKSAALEAARDAALNPTDEEALTVLRVQLRKLLTEDEALARDVARLWEEARAAGLTVTAAGDRSVGIGGDVSDTTIITGDQNVVKK